MIRRLFLPLLVAVVAATLLVLPGGGRRSRVHADVTFSSQRNPNLVIDRNGSLYLTGAVATLPESAHSPGSQIFFTRSTDGGNTWDNMPVTRNLSNSRISGIGALEPKLALTRSGKLRCFVAYDDDTLGPRQTWFVRSKKGINFQKANLLSQPGEGGFQPQVALDAQQNVNLVWGRSSGVDEQVVFSRSTDLGLTFSPELNISQSKGTALAPSIGVDTQNGLDVAWQDTASGTSTIVFSRSIDDGQTWTVPLALSTGTASTEAGLAIDKSGGIDVVWVQQISGASQLMIARSTDSGSTFSNPVQITNDPNASVDQPTLTFFGSTCYVAFQDDITGQVYLSSASPISSLNFSSPVRFSNANTARGQAHSPSIAFDGGGTLHMVFVDTSLLGSNEGLVVYTTTKDGHTFSKPTTVLAFIQF
ncbi:MAG TPA: sialidase family protein [Blastocatellia bacterium]|nr:sialidase family protein [Blastocatellia bacterium]